MNDIALGLVEVAKLLLSGYFAFAKQQGLDENQIDDLYAKSKADFKKNDPGFLPDVDEI